MPVWHDEVFRQDGDRNRQAASWPCIGTIWNRKYDGSHVGNMAAIGNWTASKTPLYIFDFYPVGLGLLRRKVRLIESVQGSVLSGWTWVKVLMDTPFVRYKYRNVRIFVLLNITLMRIRWPGSPCFSSTVSQWQPAPIRSVPGLPWQ